jgi:hypothetical protein
MIISVISTILLFFFSPTSFAGEKTGVIFLHDGVDEDYTFNWYPQYFNNMYDIFNPGFFAGGPLEGGGCYTLIHYADAAESAVCGVDEGTPIDVFCNEYNGLYPVHSHLEHSFLGDGTFGDDCSPGLFPFVLLFGHSTVDPDTLEEISGPHIDDPDAAGIGIPEFMEMAAFGFMERFYRLPDYKDIHRMQALKWWYGNDAAGYDKDPEELTNIKDRLAALRPDTEFVFRHGWQTYMENLDIYGNEAYLEGSTETKVRELIEDEGVGKIIVFHSFAYFANIFQYGHEWVDENGQGKSAIPGKTFKECVENIFDDMGPSSLYALNSYLENRPWDSHDQHSFPLITRFVKEIEPTVKLEFAPAMATFPEYEQAVLDLLTYTVGKYSIPQTASLKLILGHHGHNGGYQDAQYCDCYFTNAEEVYSRLYAKIMADFSWKGKFNIEHGACAYAEEDGQDQATLLKPNGDLFSVGEILDRSINGSYINKLGFLKNNGDHNYEYVIILPYFFDTESSGTLYNLREKVFGNNMSDGSRDDMDKDGTSYDTEDIDDEFFTVRTFDATGWPGKPRFSNETVYKGSRTHPTTVIMTGSILSLGNRPARTNLTEAAAKAIISVVEKWDSKE